MYDEDNVLNNINRNAVNMKCCSTFEDHPECSFLTWQISENIVYLDRIGLTFL